MNLASALTMVYNNEVGEKEGGGRGVTLHDARWFATSPNSAVSFNVAAQM